MIRRTLAVLAALTLVACQPTISPSPSSPSVTPPPSATGTWTRINLPDAIGSWRAMGVIADADGFIVYGGINNRPAVWTSVDATTWTSIALAGSNVFPTDGAASDGATVLIGVGTTNLCAHPSGEFVWRRARGEVDWQAAPFVQDLFCAGGFPHIAANGNLFVVAGTNGGDAPFAWRSVDGLRWVDASNGLRLDTPPALLTATEKGFLELGRGERTDAEASADGTAWQSVEAPPVPPAFNPNGQGMSPVALLSTVRGTLAIFQSDDASVLSAWRRQADGSWTVAKLSGLRVGDGISRSVTIGGQAYLFVNRGARAMLLTSADLATWIEVGIPDLDAATGLAAFDGRMVLVGSVIDPAGDEHSQVFVADVAP